MRERDAAFCFLSERQQVQLHAKRIEDGCSNSNSSSSSMGSSRISADAFTRRKEKNRQQQKTHALLVNVAATGGPRGPRAQETFVARAAITAAADVLQPC